MRSITYLCFLFLKEIQIIQSYSYGLANQAPDAEANKDSPVRECFTQMQSYCSCCLPQIPREAHGGSFTKIGDFLDKEPPPLRTKHTSKAVGRIPLGRAKTDSITSLILRPKQEVKASEVRMLHR